MIHEKGTSYHVFSWSEVMILTNFSADLRWCLFLSRAYRRDMTRKTSATARICAAEVLWPSKRKKARLNISTYLWRWPHIRRFFQPHVRPWWLHRQITMPIFGQNLFSEVWRANIWVKSFRRARRKKVTAFSVHYFQLEKLVSNAMDDSFSDKINPDGFPDIFGVSGKKMLQNKEN